VFQPFVSLARKETWQTMCSGWVADVPAAGVIDGHWTVFAVAVAAGRTVPAVWIGAVLSMPRKSSTTPTPRELTAGVHEASGLRAPATTTW